MLTGETVTGDDDADLDRYLTLTVASGRQTQQLDRPDPGALCEVRLEQRPRPAQPLRVDPHPAVAGAQQAGARRLDAGEVGLGERRAIDHRLPIDERLLAEVPLAVVGGSLACGAANGRLD